MKLRNKKTGEIGTYLYSNPQHIGLGYYSVQLDKNPMSTIQYGHNFDQLYQDWDFLGEDYEEQKEYWSINEFGSLVQVTHTRENIYDKSRKNFGNYFETKEEAEKAVEKLKVWKWLKDNGVSLKYDKDKFILHIVVSGKISPNQWRTEGYMQKLDLLFSGEDD